jgi:(p)ppGpp synthase/HD superfamily hydrolase
MPSTTPTPRLTPRFDAAVAFAFLLHRTQLRKGTDVPYVSHLLAVTALVLEHGGTEDQAIAAVLHDAVEDQGGHRTLDRIRDNFGATVAELVSALSDTDLEEKPAWRERKERYIAHLTHIPREAVLVALADKVHNARAIVRDVTRGGATVWKRFNAETPAEVVWYYHALAQALGARADERLRPMVEEFAGVVKEMGRLV